MPSWSAFGQGRERILVDTGCQQGPCLLCCVSLHGNEPFGIAAVARIARAIRVHDLSLRGRLLVFVGNQQALARNVRFIDRDLNRLWTEDRVSKLERGEVLDTGAAEDLEQLEIFNLLEEVIAQHAGDVQFVDLHTTSSEGPPFSIVSGEEHSYGLVSRVPVPIIFGLNGELEGVLAEYVSMKGIPAFIFEGGHHEGESTTDLLEAVLWVMLMESGLVCHSDMEQWSRGYEILEHARGNLPGTFEVAYRHWISPEDGFSMKPGYENFQMVHKGEELAEDKHGPVYAEEDGRIFMPLYQELGNEGFLLVRRRI